MRDTLPQPLTCVFSLSELRWPKPVRPGDELHVEGEILETRASRSNPRQGLIKVKTSTINQHGEAVQISVGNLVVPRRQWN